MQISSNNAVKLPPSQWKKVADSRILAFFRSLKSAALDFCENEISMADNLLQKAAKTARRAMRFPTPATACASYEKLMQG